MSDLRTGRALAINVIVMGAVLFGPTGPSPSSLGGDGHERIVVRDMSLATGDSVGIAFHPTDTRSTISVASRRRKDLRLCAATGAAEQATDPGESSWGNHWKGGLCRSFAERRTLKLPSYSEHVSIVIRNAGRQSVDVESITLRYRAHDRYDVVRLPFLAPGTTSARMSLLPGLTRAHRSRGLSAEAMWSPMTPAVLEVTGRARGVISEMPGDGYAVLVIKTAGLSDRELDLRVVQIRNVGPESIRPTLSFG